MSDVAARTDSWVVSGRLLAACGAAIAALVVIVTMGVHEQNRRQIPAARSVAIFSALTSSVETGPVQFGPGTAQALVSTVNHLGRMPGGKTSCGLDTGTHYRLVFTTDSGEVDVQVNLGGCAQVTISSHGSDWGTRKSDRMRTLTSAIRSALASSSRG